MMKTVNKLMLVALLGMGMAADAGLPRSSSTPNLSQAGFREGVQAGARLASGSSTPKDCVADGIYSGMVTLIGTTIIVGGASFIANEIKEYFWGDKATKSQKEEALAVDREIDIETKKINLALTEGKSLTDQYQSLSLLFNGGNNTGLDKKEIQAEIKKVWEAMKTNSAESGVIIQAAKAKIKELEQKRAGIKASAKPSTPTTLDQATQPFAHLPTVQAKPEKAANLAALTRGSAA